MNIRTHHADTTVSGGSEPVPNTLPLGAQHLAGLFLTIAFCGGIASVVGALFVYVVVHNSIGTLWLVFCCATLTVVCAIFAAVRYKSELDRAQKYIAHQSESIRSATTEIQELTGVLRSAQNESDMSKARAEEERQMLKTDVEAIVSHIYRFSEGDLTVSITAESQNPLVASLSEGFNTAVRKIRSLVSQVQETVERTGEIAHQVSIAAHQIASTAEEQAQQTTKLAMSVQGIVMGISHGVEKTGNVERIAEASGKAAESGAVVTGNTVTKMQEIASVVSEAASVVRGLGNASAEVGEIVLVIEEIADQTNLLALNAAIEAARAGDQGRGFAVVADEVRKLAERTAQATKQIGGTIRHIQRETERAVKGIERGAGEAESGLQLAQSTGSALKEIVQSAGNVALLVREVVLTSQEQASTGSTITRNVEQMSASVEETASGIGEIARSTEQLSNIVSHLQHLVRSFTLHQQHEPSPYQSDKVIQAPKATKEVALLEASGSERRKKEIWQKPTEQAVALRSGLLKVFENMYCGVFHDVEKKILEIHWTPQTERMTNEEFKEALQVFAELSEKKYTKGIFVNVLQNKHVLSPELQAWHDTNIVLRYAKAGVVKMAFLAPPSSLTRSSSESAFQEKRAKELLQVLFFEEEDAAKAWLRR